MKRFDLVKLINAKPYEKSNLAKDMHGIVINNIENYVKVLFFNPKNVGKYVIVDVNKKDILIEKEKLPANVQSELLANIEKIISKSDECLTPLPIKNYSKVELLVEDSKYAKFGIHKGDVGCVMDNDAVNNYIEVDFSMIDENGEYIKDCIAVKFEHLKVIE